MPLIDLYQHYQSAGYHAVIDTPVTHADEYFYMALLAFGAEDLPRAAHLAARAAQEAPAALLYAAAARYLDRASSGGKQSVYLSPEGFSAFIRGGGNIPLYEAASAHLRRAYTEHRDIRILDIGVGDGLALLPALTESVAHIDLVEPSAALLAQTSAALQLRGISHRSAQATLQEFAASTSERWDLIQATFSLQSLAPAERLPMLEWMRAHSERILIAEFDVPDFTAMYAPDRTQYVTERFERGLAEYQHDGGLVAQGFLMPVMFGYFDRSAARTNYEQPITDWADQLRAAGFREVERKVLYPYWWATAYLLDAR